MPTATQVSGVPVANAQPVRADVRGAIARASESTGVDFDYLLAQARLESGLNPDAKARSSSATGLYQFIDSTWLRTMDRHGYKYGYAWAGDAIGPGGGVANAGTREQLLSLRYDADVSALMAAELARDNSAGLKGFLGRDPEPVAREAVTLKAVILAAELGVDRRVRFLGRFDDRELPTLYAQAACIALPSTIEGFGIVALEAQRAGVPLCVSGAGALTEVAGSHVPHFTSDNPVDCARAIQAALAIPSSLLDEDRDRANRFTWSGSAERLCEAWRSAANHGNS